MAEFRVKPVQRWIVTRWDGRRVDTLGEYENEGFAKEVKKALEGISDPTLLAETGSNGPKPGLAPV